MENMENKKTNSEYTMLNNKIFQLDTKVDDEKKKIKQIEELQEQVTNLNKNLSICIALLAKSMRGPTTQNMFNDMYNNNQSFYKCMTASLEEESLEIQKSIGKLLDENENAIKEYKEKLKEE